MKWRLFIFFLFSTTCIWAQVPVTVKIGQPGNTADQTGFGAVSYVYHMGKFEVSNQEYAAFLNVAARDDRWSLYDERMAGEYGGILRKGSAGRYVYEVKQSMAGKPVGFVTWESCIRYANWLSNGRRSLETERGAYEIKANGEVVCPDHEKLAKGQKVYWLLATENEWYKAAYYDPVAERYWPYATTGDALPKCNLNSNQPTDVGSFQAPSPFGTYDQNGNAWEYNEHRSGNKVGLRGGSYWINDHSGYAKSGTRYDVLSAKWPHYGFRVVAVGGGASKGGVSSEVPLVVKIDPVVEAPVVRTSSQTFYVSASSGNDAWNGTSPTHAGVRGPWKTLARASVEYLPGDTILLKRGDTWHEEFAPKGSGTPEHPITIAAYGEGDRPVIDRLDDQQDLTGIRLSDQEGFMIVGLEFARCMTGIYAEYSDGVSEKKNIWIENCYFRDALKYQRYEDYPRRKIGLGICFFSWERDNRVVLSNIMIKNCVFRRLASGVWTNSPDNFNKNASYVYNFRNMVMEDCLFEEGYQWPQGIRGVDTGRMKNCITHDIGRNFLSFNGVAGSMFFRCKNWVFEDCEWGFVSIGNGSGDGEAFDFEGNCDNMVMRNCLFHDTDGPGFLMCCYASDGHPHTGLVMENCVINGKSNRPIGLPRCAIVNTTDWNESLWRHCRFYLSPGEAVMRVMDPEKDKRTSFENCFVKDLSAACSSVPHPAKVSAGKDAQGRPWLQLDFGKVVPVNEFRLDEKAGSSLRRYQLEYWDSARGRWASCFNGRTMGPAFVAPVVTRRTSKARLRLLDTESGPPGMAGFAAYHDPLGEAWNVPRGHAVPDRIGR